MHDEQRAVGFAAPVRLDQSAPHPEHSKVPDHSAYSPWTWPAVIVTCVLVVAALAFALVLILTGATDPFVTILITLLLVTGIVLCVLPSREGGDRFTQRMLRAVVAFANNAGGPR